MSSRKRDGGEITGKNKKSSELPCIGNERADAKEVAESMKKLDKERLG